MYLYVSWVYKFGQGHLEVHQIILAISTQANTQVQGHQDNIRC